MRLSRSLLLFPALSLFLGWTAPALAEESAQPPVQQAMTPDEQAKVRQQMQALAKAMGITPEQPAQPAAAASQPQPAKEKTVAEVADKALDMVNGLVVSVSQALQKVAPEVWRIMVRQQYAKAASGCVVPASLLLLVLVFWFILRKKWVLDKDVRHDDEERIARIWIAWVVPCVLGFIFSIWLAVRLSDSITYLINPEFYAVRDLLLMIMNPAAAGQM